MWTTYNATGTFPSKVKRTRTKFDHFAACANPAVSVYSAFRARQTSLKGYADGNISYGFVLTKREAITWSVFSRNKDPIIEVARFAGLTAEVPERQYCTEFRILNALAIDGDVRADDEAFVDLYTDNAPCNSCAQVIREFMSSFPKARMRIIYQHHSHKAPYCDWPRQLAEWDHAIVDRIKYKRFLIPKTQDTFTVGSRYAFVDLIEGEKIIKWRYQLESIDSLTGDSCWKDDVGNTYRNVEFRPDYDEVYLYYKKRPDDLTPLPRSWLEQWNFD